MRTLLGTAVVLSLAGCGTAPGDGSADGIALPPTTGAADYQLGGAYRPEVGVTAVTRDSTDPPAPGIYSICYVNGFQTQPGDHWPPTAILHTPSGAPIVDPNWPDEHIIDISTAAKRRRAAVRIDAITRRCASKGFRAVEFDNLDSFTRSDHKLTLRDAIAFASLLVEAAHADHLAAGQKNTAELGSAGKQVIGFDFAVSEECDAYNECAKFTNVYGNHVIDIEYTDNLRGTFQQVCKRSATPRMTILRDRGLLPAGTPGAVYAHC